jgi:hypothetical protein
MSGTESGSGETIETVAEEPYADRPGQYVDMDLGALEATTKFCD